VKNSRNGLGLSPNMICSPFLSIHEVFGYIMTSDA
jgi:hypothetical protein